MYWHLVDVAWVLLDLDMYPACARQLAWIYWFWFLHMLYSTVNVYLLSYVHPARQRGPAQARLPIRAACRFVP